MDLTDAITVVGVTQERVKLSHVNIEPSLFETQIKHTQNALLTQLLRQYLYSCTNACVSICTFVLVKQVN